MNELKYSDLDFDFLHKTQTAAKQANEFGLATEISPTAEQLLFFDLCKSKSLVPGLNYSQFGVKQYFAYLSPPENYNHIDDNYTLSENTELFKLFNELTGTWMFVACVKDQGILRLFRDEKCNDLMFTTHGLRNLEASKKLVKLVYTIPPLMIIQQLHDGQIGLVQNNISEIGALLRVVEFEDVRITKTYTEWHHDLFVHGNKYCIVNDGSPPQPSWMYEYRELIDVYYKLKAVDMDQEDINCGTIFSTISSHFNPDPFLYKLPGEFIAFVISKYGAQILDVIHRINSDPEWKPLWDKFIQTVKMYNTEVGTKMQEYVQQI